jgi:hypothetical protein
MARKTNFSFSLQLNFDSRAEENSAYETIEQFISAQGGELNWKTVQRGGGVTVNTKIFIPVNNLQEADAKCKLIENRLEHLPRGRGCVGNVEVDVTQTGLPE